MPACLGGMKMTVVLRQHETERIVDWHDEWRRIENVLAELPAEARIAVKQLVQEFEAEDSASRDRAA
jgi:hypothetical protein